MKKDSPEPPLIHPERISDRPLVFEATVPVSHFPRLAEALANDDGELRYRVTAHEDPQRRKVVSCIIEGFVFLTCQTSLEAFRHEVRIKDRLVLVAKESELPPIEEESDAEDYVVAASPVDVLELVEDAVLLALPMVPRKPGLQEPSAEKRHEDGGESPFAALASLKKRST